MTGENQKRKELSHADFRGFTGTKKWSRHVWILKLNRCDYTFEARRGCGFKHRAMILSEKEGDPEHEQTTVDTSIPLVNARI